MTTEPTATPEGEAATTALPSTEVLNSMGDTALRELVQNLARERTELSADLTTKQDKIDELAADTQLLRDSRDRAITRADEHSARSFRLATELGEFKAKVIEVSMRYAKKHDWCSVVQNALEEMGLEPPSRSITATVTITYELEAQWTGWGDITTAALDDALGIDYDAEPLTWAEETLDDLSLSQTDFSIRHLAIEGEAA